MNGSTALEGVPGNVNTFDFECARLLDHPDLRRTMGGLLRKMR